MANGRTLLVFTLVLANSVCSAINVKHFYPFGFEHGDKTLPKSDDLSSNEIRLRAPIAFYRQLHRSLFINLNGHLSFGVNFPGYRSDIRLPTGHTLIAPFLADIDTRASGDVFYRETTDRKLLQKAGRMVRENFAALSAFRPRALFVVTWKEVGYFREKSDKKNTFQVVIINDGRDHSVVIFNYGDTEWIKADGKTSSLDNMAFAGFEDGSRGGLYMLPGSGQEQILNISDWSNVKARGVWMFRVGMVDKIMPPDEQGNKFLEAVGPEEGVVHGDVCSRCHQHATCVEKRTGFCCQCKEGFFGNGHSCIESGVTIRINGKLSGELDSTLIDSIDTHSYIVSSTGRTFTAISRIPTSVGPSMRRLGVIGRIFGWMFAVPRVGYKNGYMLTGGVFNHTAEVHFPSTGERATVKHQFKGHDQLNNVVMTSQVNGSIPKLSASDDVQTEPGEENYRETKPGTIESTSTFIHLVNGVPSRVVYTQKITYHACASRDDIMEPSTLKIRRSYLRYNEAEQRTVRFAMATSIGPKAGEVTNPCKGPTTCSDDANCTPRGTSYVCRCKSGYTGNGNECEDIDECRSRQSNDCDPLNGRCFNLKGSFECRCNAGYRGDGRVCNRSSQLRCDDLRCDANARCLYDAENDGVKCVCLDGFRGDGTSCTAVEFSCNDVNICDENAECVLNNELGVYECQCNDGFSGDGESCTDTGETEINCKRCDANAQCIFDVVDLIHRCQCRAGFTGDGYSCTTLVQDCSSLRCDRNARCSYNSDTRLPECTCSRGYEGDGFTCTVRSCFDNRNICSPDGSCLFDGTNHVCRCNRGFRGDGFRCEAYGCDRQNYCDRNAQCVKAVDGQYRCQCNTGYTGDGVRCEVSNVATCNVLNNCDVNADCISTAEGYKCRCRRNFQGSGFRCTPVVTCSSRPDLCDRNAACERQGEEYLCVCKSGYRGDGRYCTPSRVSDSYLLYTQGESIIRLPFDPTTGNPGGPIIISQGETLVGLDVDCRENYVFWTDVAKGTISRARLDRSDKQVILRGLGSPEGVAVDWVSRNLYWTDSARDTIEVSKLDGTNRKLLLKDGMVDPRAIAVHPAYGKIYWTDWNRNDPKIEVADMNGANRRVLVKDNLGLPNGLNLDFDRRELCWTDAGVHTIECIGLEGNNRRMVFDAAFYPFGITKSNDALYWTDWTLKSIQNINNNGGTLNPALPFPLGGKGRPHTIKAVPINCPRGANACTYNNGGCKFLCLPDSNRGSTCACPDDVDEAACNEIVRV